MGEVILFSAAFDMILLLVAAGVIALAVFIAREFERIAVMKGHPGRRYFWWTLLTGVIGMLMVAALPDRSAPPAGNGPVPDRLPPL